MINEVTLIGRLGKDPELRTTQTQQSKCTLWLATSENYMSNGQRQERTEWHTVVVWGNQAKPCADYLHKGSSVYVKGRIQSREYDDRDGNKRKAYEIVASAVKFLDPKRKDAPPAQPAPTVNNADMDDIPF